MAGYRAKQQHAPIDENVQLPAAIRAAAARSDALHKQAYETAEPTPVVPPVEPPVQQQAPVEPTPPAETTPPPAANDDADRRYEGMKGRYERAQETIIGLTTRISNLEAMLARQVPTPAPVQQPTPDLTFKAVSKEDRETYGEEFIDVAQRAAQEKISPEIAELRREIASLKGTMETAEERNARLALDRMYAHMTDQLPNWRTINRDPKFIAWANLPDPFSGAIRINLMKDAFGKFEADRVLNFFKGFLSDEAATGPAASHTEMPTGKVPLETFAAPGRAKAPAVAETPGAKETISQAQIASFYLDVQKGKYRGNEAEKARLEQMIFDAQADGRITP